MKVQIEDWGIGLTLKEAVEKQEFCWAERVYNQAPDRLIFAEHQPVYSAGLSLAGNIKGQKRCFKKEIWELPAGILVTKRGGLVTYQGPGMLSVYCIFEMKNHSPRWLINILEDSAQKLLELYGICTRKSCFNNPGLYIDKNKKIASIGFRVARGVSQYGLTVSLDPDQKYLDPLIPCGLVGVEMTSLAQEVGRKKFSPAEKDTIKTVLATEIVLCLNRPRHEKVD